MENLDSVSFLKGMYFQMKHVNYISAKKRIEILRLKTWIEELEKSEFAYDLIDKKPYLVVNRPDQEFIKSADKGKIGMCLFCGKNHKHGLMDGHRRPHCKSDNNDGNIILDCIKHKDGTILYQDDGYFIRDEIKA